jgi:hypothetical protein
MLDQKTKQVLSGFPSNVPVAIDPTDPMNKLVSGAYSTGLRFIEYKLQQSLLGRFPINAHLTEIREICSASLASKLINPVISGVKSLSAPLTDTLTAFTLATTEDDFLYGQPTAAHLVRTETTTLPAGYESYDVTGLTYTRPDSTLPGKLHYLINTWIDDTSANGKTFSQDITTDFGDITFGAQETPVVFQSVVQNYDTVGYDSILDLVPTAPDAGTAADGTPLTAYTAALPHGWVSGVVVYDIGNLDVNGVATVVAATEYSIDANTGIITFNTFTSGTDYIPRPSYTLGAQGDPGWNSTYMAEYTYIIYKNAFGLSPLNYVQDTGKSDDVLLAGMTPNSVTPVPVPFQFSSYSFTDKAVCLRIGGYDLSQAAPVYIQMSLALPGAVRTYP